MQWVPPFYEEIRPAWPISAWRPVRGATLAARRVWATPGNWDPPSIRAELKPPPLYRLRSSYRWTSSWYLHRLAFTLGRASAERCPTGPQFGAVHVGHVLCPTYLAAAKLSFRNIQIKVAYPKSSNELLIWPLMAVGFVIRLGSWVSVDTVINELKKRDRIASH